MPPRSDQAIPSAERVIRMIDGSGGQGHAETDASGPAAVAVMTKGVHRVSPGAVTSAHHVDGTDDGSGGGHARSCALKICRIAAVRPATG